MNPRQRRGALLMVLAGIGAVAVFLSVSTYVADIERQVGPLESVIRLTADVAAYEPIPEDAVEVVTMPARWKPPLALESLARLQGMVLQNDLPAGTLLEQGDITTPPEIPPGFRQVAIMVNAETGVAGQIRVGDRVDIVATQNGTNTSPARTTVAVQDAEILSIGTTQAAADDLAGIEGVPVGFTADEVVPITFILEPDDVQRLLYVEAFGSIRLALRRPGDHGVLSSSESTYSPQQTQQTTGQ